jgi:hypothetical protein
MGKFRPEGELTQISTRPLNNFLVEFRTASLVQHLQYITLSPALPAGWLGLSLEPLHEHAQLYWYALRVASLPGWRPRCPSR